MRKIGLLIIFLSLILTGQSQDNAKQSFSIEDAVSYAVKHNYSLVNSQKDIEISRQKVKEIISIGLPQLNGEGTFNDFLKVPVMQLPDFFFAGMPGMLDGPPSGKLIPVEIQQKYSLTGSLTASQLLFDGSYFVGVQATKVYVQITEKLLQKQELDIKVTVGQTYLMVLIIEENIKILEQSLVNVNKILGETEIIESKGFLEATDVDQIKLLKINLESMLNKLVRQKDASYNLLKFLMGIKIESDIALSDNVNNLLLKANNPEMLTKEVDIKNNFDMQIVLNQEAANKLVLKKEKYGYMPSLYAFFSHQQNFMGDKLNVFDKDANWYPTSLWGLTLKVPLFDFGSKHYKIQQAKLELEKTKVLETQVEESIKMELINARSDYKSTFEALKKEQSNMELSQKIYDRTIIKYNNGMVTSMELTQTHNQYLNNQSSYYNSILEYLTAKIKLDKVLNQL